MTMKTEDTIHKLVHKKLHAKLDELVADFIRHTNKLPSETKLIDFLHWSYEQTIKPTERSNG